MTFRKFFVLGAAVVALGVAAGAAFAQTPAQKSLIDEAKAQGVVGEQADGYLGVRTTADPELQTAVTATNSARRRVYAASAADVLHNQLLFQRGAHRLRNQSRHRVSRATGSKRDNHRNGFLRVRVGVNQQRC